MRITNNMLINNMIGYIGNNLNNMSKYQNQLATGKKIAVPSDDPVVAARALKLRTDVAEIDQYKRNVSDAVSWMDMTESALGNIGDVLHRARELAVQGANGTLSEDDSKKIKEEISQLKTQLIHLGNTTYAGRYIFSGFDTDKPLIDEQTGMFALNVKNSENIKYEIGIGDDININVTGGDLFNNGLYATTADVPPTSGTLTGGASVTGPVLTIGAPSQPLQMVIDGEAVTVDIPGGTTYNIPADLNNLALDIQTAINGKTASAADVTVAADAGGKLVVTSGSTGKGSYIRVSPGGIATDLGLDTTIRTDGVPQVTAQPKMIKTMDKLITALDNGDQAAVSQLLNDIDEDMGNVLRVRADVGARQNRLELTSNRLENDTINFTKLMSENEDVDQAETIMNLQNEENVYRASLAGGARIIMPSLIDFLR